MTLEHLNSFSFPLPLSLFPLTPPHSPSPSLLLLDPSLSLLPSLPLPFPPLLPPSSSPSELSSPDLPSLLLQFCKQVVDGLACLARKSFVHRDIAARNILLDKDLNCKVREDECTYNVMSIVQMYIHGYSTDVHTWV